MKGRETQGMTTKAELIALIADKSGLSQAQAKEVVEAFTATVTESLKKGQEVRLIGFGSFVPVKRAERTGRNPRTGETVKSAASRTARFRPAVGLKTALGGPHGGGTGADD